MRANRLIRSALAAVSALSAAALWGHAAPAAVYHPQCPRSKSICVLRTVWLSASEDHRSYVLDSPFLFTPPTSDPGPLIARSGMREEARAVQAILAGYHSVNGSDDPIIVWVIRFPDACVRSHGDVSGCIRQTFDDYYVAATGKVLFGGTDCQWPTYEP